MYIYIYIYAWGLSGCIRNLVPCTININRYSSDNVDTSGVLVVGETVRQRCSNLNDQCALVVVQVAHRKTRKTARNTPPALVVIPVAYHHDHTQEIRHPFRQFRGLTFSRTACRVQLPSAGSIETSRRVLFEPPN